MTNQPDPDFSDTARRVILSIYLPAFLTSMCQGIALLVIPLYALDLSANASITALVFSLRGLGNVAFDIPAGTLATLILALQFVPQSSKQRAGRHDPILTSQPDTIRQQALW